MILNNKNNKKFISFEGIEGVGKSTHIQYVAQLLANQHQDYIITREPGGTPLAESIRQVLLKQAFEEKIWPDTEILLLYAARMQHIHEVIYPALNKNQWVLCDRFIDATFAYQGGGRGIPLDRIQSLNNWALKDFKPELTFLLDAPPEVGFSRIENRGALDRIEQEKIDFFRAVRASYLDRAQEEPERFKIIDATQNIETIQLLLKEIVDNIIIKNN